LTVKISTKLNNIQPRRTTQENLKVVRKGGMVGVRSGSLSVTFLNIVPLHTE
jgi:hypothetical protein